MRRAKAHNVESRSAVSFAEPTLDRVQEVGQDVEIDSNWQLEVDQMYRINDGSPDRLSDESRTITVLSDSSLGQGQKASHVTEQAIASAEAKSARRERRHLNGDVVVNAAAFRLAVRNPCWQ